MCVIILRMLLQEYLRKGNTPEDLNREFAVKIHRHPKYPELVQFSYDQIESPMQEKIVQECRGVILNSNDNWKIVCRSFDKFFNLGEPNAAKIDWDSARVQEKLDGTLINLYWYDDRWNVATTGSPDGGGQVGDFEFTFSELFWKVFYDMGFSIENLGPSKDLTISFELMTPFNKIVVRHRESKICLIGVRNHVQGYQVAMHQIPSSQPIPRVREFQFYSELEILNSFRLMDATEQEGYVVIDKFFNRIKIKHPRYVILHHVKSSMTVKKMLSLIMIGEAGEVVSYFPEYDELYQRLSFNLEVLTGTVMREYSKIQHLETQKEFALEAVKHPFSSYLFRLRKGEKLWEDIISKDRPENILHYMDTVSSK